MVSCTILSGNGCPPLTVRYETGNEETSISLSSCSHKPSNPHTSPPLVDLYFPTPQLHPSLRSNNDFTEQESPGSISVTSSSSSLSNIHLPHGVGPIFNFGSISKSPGQGSSLSINTHLIYSRLVNVSSQPSSCLPRSDANLQSQTMVGVKMSGCSNHLYGTTCRDINDGGSVICQNSSFFRCSTNLEPSSTHPNYTLQHRTGEDQKFFFDRSSDSSTITFTRSTFHTMTSTNDGAAIYARLGVAHIAIDECSFIGCQCTGTVQSGGAVCASYADGKASVSILSCFFSDCQADNYGGTPESEVHISHNFFSDGKANFGGAFQTVTVTDSYFEKCNATRGGAIFINSTTSFKLNSLTFTACTSSSGKDLCLYSHSKTDIVETNMIVNCMSTSGASNVYFEQGKLLDSDLIPQVASIDIPSITVVASFSPKETGWKLTVYTSEPVERKILVVLDNSLSEYEKPTFNSPPPIARLFVFDFASGELSKSQTFQISEWNLLQYESNYSITIPFLIGAKNTHTFDYNFSTPNPPRIVEATCEIKDGDPTTGIIHLKGRTLDAGDYIVKLKEVDGFQISVSFAGSPASPDSRTMISSTTEVLLFGEDSILEYGKEYEILSVQKVGAETFLLLDPPQLFMLVPNPPRLSLVGTCLFPKPLDKSTISIPLSGTEIPTGPYSMNVSLVGDEQSSNITLTATFSSAESGTATAVVFDAADGDVDLIFGSEYSIESLWNDDGSIWIPFSLSFAVPSSPGIVESFVSAVFNKESTRATLTFSGTDFVSGPTRVVLLDGSTKINSNSDVRVMDKTHLTVTITAGWTQSSSTVAYGRSYSINSVASSSKSFLVRSSVLVIIPSPPCVTGISCDMDSHFTHFLLSFTGQDLPISGTYTASLKSSSFSFSVTFADGVGTSERIEANATNSLLYDTAYTLSSLSQGNNQIILNTTSFSTPPGPTLSDVQCSLDSSDFHFVLLTLTGSRMPSSSEYTLIVVETGESAEISLPVSFTSSTDGFGRVEVYKKDNTLKYDRTYSVVSLSLGSLSITIPDSITFPTPSEPIRIEDATAKLNDDRSKAIIALVGVKLQEGSWMVTISTTPPLEVPGQLGEDGSLVFSVNAGFTDPTQLIFGLKYKIEAVTLDSKPVLVNNDVFFTVPHAPFVSSAFISFVNFQNTSCQISFDGAHLPLMDEYTVVLSPFISFPISFTSTSKGKSPTLSIGSPNSLQYSETYTIASITKTSNPLEVILTDPSIVIETGPKPTWLSMTVNEGGSDRTEECGSVEEPCGSVAWGWRAGKRQLGGEGICIWIKKEVRFGERIWVGSEQLTIQTASGNRSRLTCEDSLIESPLSTKERKGIVTIGDGLVSFTDLVLSLPATSSEEVGGHFVVSGKGSFLVESVQIVSEGGGRVGMGVGWVEGGQMDVNGVVLVNASFEVTLFGAQGEREAIQFSVSNLNIQNTTTSDALIHFSSLSPSSSFSLSHSSFLTTIRTINSASSPSSNANLSLISISTSQDSVSVDDCVFEKSGTCLSSSPSTFIGNTLHIALSSPIPSKSTVVISLCLFVDCLGSSGSGALHISTGTHSAIIVLSNNWFENLLSGNEWPSRKGGIAVLDWTRSASVASSSSHPVGVLVEYGTLCPTIIRRRCVLSNSRLVMQKA
ncbi:hypothetical protein BLNAU_5594 [Blattamonas nauphoetae]|uniref:Uncharacterized protein n=1 Tax=Blattamonas nauphoetae TaxID=2049346 RepID=A0ABQ9Y702_9EUKA|nr:hypothetical protein BLNAU_5594 [Blattamonas nauphoetae]